MSTVYLIRHGWSEGNENKRFCGWSDVELTAEGRLQLEALSRQVPDPVPKVLYSSPLQRALESARVLSEAWGSEIRTIKGFRELHFGAFENRTWANIMEKYPSQAEAWAHGGLGARPPGGESVEDLIARVVPVFHECLAEQGAEPWGLVAHGGVFQALLAAEVAHNPEAYWHFSVRHGSLCRLEYAEDGFAVLKALSCSG